MRALVDASELTGTVSVPPSKSYTIRALMCAALARGESEIVSPLGSDDTEAAIDVLGRVGIRVSQGDSSWRVSGGNYHEPDTDLFCRESAATLRFMTAICSLIPGQFRLTPAPSLARRPVEPLLQALRQLGVDCRQEEGQSVMVKGGDLRGGTTALAGNISSQYVSALLLISPLAMEGMTIRLTTPLESRPYVLMTLECLKKFGVTVTTSSDLRVFETSPQEYKPTEYRVEGDWSSASYLLALGALCGRVEVQNLEPQSLQGDKAILDFLRDMGASITIEGNSVTVNKSRLRAITANLSDCIDLLPTIAVLAAAAEGVSRFTGIERARLKESNRVSTLRAGLEAMGIKVIEEVDSLSITGSAARGAVIDTGGDHRMAMAFSLLGLVAGGTMIENAECVAKTYPEYWDTIKKLGARVRLE